LYVYFLKSSNQIHYRVIISQKGSVYKGIGTKLMLKIRLDIFLS